MDDLRPRTASAAREYELLGAARLIRQLLLDEERLVDQVNRDRRQAIVFRVGDNSRLEDMALGMGAVMLAPFDGFDPDTALPSSTTIELKRDAFFARRVMYVAGQDVSVKDMVLYTAHVAGGVHAGAPKSAQDRLLQALSQEWIFGDLPGGLRALQAIGRVVVKALRPLEDTVRRDLGMPPLV